MAINLCFLDGFDDGTIGNVMSQCHYYVFEEDIFDNIFQQNALLDKDIKENVQQKRYPLISALAVQCFC